MDFLDAINLNLFASEIFVFTPKGEIKTMPAGCTALDFAFQIHTFLGSHCIGAKVNHKLVPLSHRLQSGDQVEILTSKSQYVQPTWLNFVSTAKAKAKITAALRKQDREAARRGEEMLEEWLRSVDMQPTSSVLNRLCDYHSLQKHESLFLAIGKKNIVLGNGDLDELRGKHHSQKDGASSGWRKYVPFLGHDKKKNPDATAEPIVVDKSFDKKKTVVISEATIGKLTFLTCCHPIPGDDVLGYIDNASHIAIHKRACPVAARLKTSFGNRILDAKWDMHKQLFFDAIIEIRGIDRKGMLYDVSQVISDKMDINMKRITVSSDQGIFDGSIELHVHDRDEVKIIIENLKQIDGLQEVQQIM